MTFKLPLSERNQTVLIVSVSVVIVAVLFICVFKPWRSAAPALPPVTADESFDDEIDEREADDMVSGAGAGAKEYTATQDRDSQQAARDHHRMLLMRGPPSMTRRTASPTTSAVLLAAMRSPARSRTGAASVDYQIDDYDISKIRPAELGRTDVGDRV